MRFMFVTFSTLCFGDVFYDIHLVYLFVKSVLLTAVNIFGIISLRMMFV